MYLEPGPGWNPLRLPFRVGATCLIWARDRAERQPRPGGVGGLRYLPAVQRSFPDTFIFAVTLAAD